MIDDIPAVEQVHIFEEKTKTKDRESGACPHQAVLNSKVFLPEICIETCGEKNLRGKYHSV